MREVAHRVRVVVVLHGGDAGAEMVDLGGSGLAFGGGSRHDAVNRAGEHRKTPVELRIAGYEPGHSQAHGVSLGDEVGLEHAIDLRTKPRFLHKL